MNNIYVRLSVTAKAGVAINVAAKEAVELADSSNTQITFTFNDITQYITPDMSASDVVEKHYEKLEEYQRLHPIKVR